MIEIRFYYHCGAPLREGTLPTEHRPRFYCESCGHIHYINPKVVCGTLPVDQGKVWLLRRGIEPRLGFWTHPAGFLEIDETTEEGALRETLEEIGCEVEIDRLLGVYSRPYGAVNVIYLARRKAARSLPCTTPEATEVRAFSPDELPWQELAFSSTQAALQDWLRLYSGDSDLT